MAMALSPLRLIRIESRVSFRWAIPIACIGSSMQPISWRRSHESRRLIPASKSRSSFKLLSSKHFKTRKSPLESSMTSTSFATSLRLLQAFKTVISYLTHYCMLSLAFLGIDLSTNFSLEIRCWTSEQFYVTECCSSRPPRYSYKAIRERGSFWARRMKLMACCISCQLGKSSYRNSRLTFIFMEKNLSWPETDSSLARSVLTTCIYLSLWE